MSSLGDAFKALKNVMLLHERIAGVEDELETLTDNMQGLRDYILAVDKRVIRLEALVEFTARSAGREPPQIEG